MKIRMSAMPTPSIADEEGTARTARAKNWRGQEEQTRANPKKMGKDRGAEAKNDDLRELRALCRFCERVAHLQFMGQVRPACPPPARVCVTGVWAQGVRHDWTHYA